MKSVILCLTLFIGAAGLASASTNDILVLFNGSTEVNRETFKFIKRGLVEQKVDGNLVASQDAKSVKPQNYKAIIILNSGLTSGIDPVLKSFIEKNTDKKDLFVVNLIKGSDSLTIQTLPAAKNPEGLDAVTAASKWSEGSDKMTYVKLHQEWIKVLADFLKSRK